ncbi:hypothetical protein BI008_gp23 [Citrobacter phage SH4]|uniref:Uncharacterized protein n=1 Tax=Citrobacter phage SH4 TaxID=1805467 RepID=A0A1B1LKF7_9CAUD|nr:hypothetical protein BI008_gp23 [Citrobacter phage SH4]ANS53190.1 hypothetical protein sh4_0049 [Citrobacter phage SH4]
MKKVDPFRLLTLEGLALYVSFLILLLPWSAISKGILLMLSSFVCLSVALRAIPGWLDTLSTTSSRDGLNRLSKLVEAEKKIAARGKTTTSDRDIADYKNFMEDR